MTPSSRPLPHGAWPSPVSADEVVAAGIGLDGIAATTRPDGAVVAWWSEVRPTEQGRSAIVSREPGGERVEWLRPGLNARTRVHEYGGAAWAPLADGVVLSSFADSRLYRVDAPQAEPVPLTPDTDGTVRYADLSACPDGTSIVCVRDVLAEPTASPVRSLVHLDTTDGAETSLFSGPHFLSTARVSPDGTRLCWLSWEHPHLPWDHTTLWLARLDGTTLTAPVQVAGGQALFQPGWTEDGRLLVVAERGDWWNLHEVHELDGTPSLRVVREADSECGWPGWRFGMSSWAPLDQGRVVLKHGVGRPGLWIVDLDDGSSADLDLPMSSLLPQLATAGGLLVCGVGTATGPTRLLAVRPGGEPVELARSAPDPDPRWVAEPEHLQVPGRDGRTVHAYVYPPTNPQAAAADGELPPYLMTVHGGPTGGTQVGYSALRSFWTSRGIGVVDVDYGGSTGYGRSYRQALYGQWGVVDVQDCVSVAEHLGTRGWPIPPGSSSPVAARAAGRCSPA